VPSLEERLAVLSPHLYDAVPLSVTAKQAGISARTAQRWLAGYRADGASALVRSGRADRGGWRIAAELVELIEGLALRRPAPQIAQVYRKLVEVAVQRGLPAPSYTSVRRVIHRLDRGLLALAHHDPDVYRDDFELVLRREAVHPNDVWQADHTELDVQILDESGRSVRPWLTVILDDHSRAVAGYTVFWGARPRCRPRWRCGRRSGAKRTRGGRFAGSRRRCTPITERISPALTSARSARTCGCS